MNKREEDIFTKKAETIKAQSSNGTFQKIEHLLKILNNKHADIKELKQSTKQQDIFLLKPSYELSKDILYIKIPSWSKRLGDIDRELIDICKMNVDKYEKIVIDVRENQGGNSTTAHNFAGIFFKDKVIFGKIIKRDKKGKLEELKQILIPDKDIYIDKKIIILISKKCFSSTELFLAPFKVAKRALLVGDKTAGGSANPICEPLIINGKKYEVRIPTWKFFLKGKRKPLEATRIDPDIKYLKNNIVEYTKKL
ncbi:hypothetical protein HYW46_01900 [Candidatus Daviesbacteria bacterium]|nr:hypothetical protein [Candidatus Daviesbacteria bacterium]